jgi:hypothetical protein
MVGMWKAFEEMESIGWMPRTRRPRMISVQADGCAPIVRAFQQGAEKAPMWEGAATIADGLRVPRAIGDFLILRAVRESGGTALSVPDRAMVDGMIAIGGTEGVSAAPEGTARRHQGAGGRKPSSATNRWSCSIPAARSNRRALNPAVSRQRDERLRRQQEVRVGRHRLDAPHDLVDGRATISGGARRPWSQVHTNPDQPPSPRCVASTRSNGRARAASGKHHRSRFFLRQPRQRIATIAPMPPSRSACPS